MHKNNGNQTRAQNHLRIKIEQQERNRSEEREGVNGCGRGILSLSHLCALSSMQCRETGIRTPMLLDGLVVFCAFPIVAVRICDYQGTFEGPLPPFLQPKCHRVLQRVDVGLVFDDF